MPVMWPIPLVKKWIEHLGVILGLERPIPPALIEVIPITPIYKNKVDEEWIGVYGNVHEYGAQVNPNTPNIESFRISNSEATGSRTLSDTVTYTHTVVIMNP